MNGADFTLPIQIERRFTTNLFHTLPLCVLKNDPFYTDWVCENFINIHIEDQENISYTNQFLRFLGFSHDIFQQDIIFDHVVVKNISEYIENRMTRLGDYCYILLDEFYLSEKPAYQTRHFFHDSLIFGCNTEKREFLALTLGKKEIIEEIRISYGDLSAAYEPFAKASHGVSAVFFRRTYEKRLQSFSFERYLSRLIHYVNGVGNQERRIYIPEAPLLSPFGTNVYPLFAEHLRKRGALNFNEFKQFHFLYEHKNALLDSFRFLSEKGYADDRFDVYRNRFEGIARRMAQLRMLAMKVMRKQNHEGLEQLADKLLALGKQEHEILFGLTEHLKNTWNCDTYIPFDRFEPLYADKMLNITASAQITKLGPGRNCGHYQYAEVFEIAWEDTVHIECVSFVCKERIDIDCGGECIWQSNGFDHGDARRPYFVAVKKPSRFFRLHVFGNSPIDIGGLHLNVFSGSITHGKKITATSCWKDGGEGCHPEWAIDYTENFWNAKADFDGPESLEVDLETVYPVNRVVLQEREAHRIRHYKIEALSDKGAAVFSADFKGVLPDSPVVHDFPAVSARSLKLTILETERDAYGYSEPGIKRFEAYYCPACPEPENRMEELHSD